MIAELDKQTESKQEQHEDYERIGESVGSTCLHSLLKDARSESSNSEDRASTNRACTNSSSKSQTKPAAISRKNSFCRTPEYNAGIAISRGLSKDGSETGAYEDRPHEFLRKQCEFTAQTFDFLQRYSKDNPPVSNLDGSRTFFIPLHGITDRALAENDSSDVKYFESMMKLTVPAGAHNLDQCWFQRSPRQEETKEEFQKDLDEELSGSKSLRPIEGPLNFFTHGCFSGAGVTDTDAIRLSMLTGAPTVTVDWRSTPGPWYTLPFRYVVDYYSAVLQEKAFESALDESISFVDPSRALMVSFSRGAAFNAAYMNHRFENRKDMPPIYGHVMAHADLSTNTFTSRVNGNNPLTSASDKTVVLGNHNDTVLFLSRFRIFGDRVGDAMKSDITAVTGAGGTYVIDDVQRKGGNMNHYVNYNLIAKLLRNMAKIPKSSAIIGNTTNPETFASSLPAETQASAELTRKIPSLPGLTPSMDSWKN